MAIIKCKMCGGDLQITADMTVAECEYCGSKQTIPTVDNEKKLTLFSRANRLRFACEFDKAAGVYEALVADFPEEAEAYWGLVLCKYGIEYVDDPATGRKIPTCHRSSFESVMDDSNLEQALENADVVARKLYREEAKQIEELRKGIIEVSGKEAPYDIFICYKETDEKGERTLDSVLAQDVYDALTSRGYRVFFSRITLEDKLGQEYEPYIFAALNSAKIMLAFGTDYEYFNAVWVKNEWSRYLQLMTKDKSKHMIPCYKGIDAYDMPKEFNKLQAQDLGKVGAIQDLLRGIEKVIPKNAPAAIQAPGDGQIQSMLHRGQMALEDGDWTGAREFFEGVLNLDSRNTGGYIGLALAGAGQKTLEIWLQARVRETEHAPVETMIIEEDGDYVDELTRRFRVPGWLEDRDCRRILEENFYYKSTTACRRAQLEAEKQYWGENRPIARAVQFAGSEEKQALEAGIRRVLDTMEARLLEAEQQEQRDVRIQTDAYRTFLTSAARTLEEESQKARKQREEAYQAVITKDLKAITDPQELKKDTNTLERMGSYRDSETNLRRIRWRIQELAAVRQKQEEEEQARLEKQEARQRRKKRIRRVTIALILFSLYLGVSAVQMYYKDDLKVAYEHMKAGRYSRAADTLGIPWPLNPGKKYDEGEYLLYKGNIAGAAMAFGAARDYKDAPQRSRELWEQIRQDYCTILLENYHGLAVTQEGTVISVHPETKPFDQTISWTDVVHITANDTHIAALRSDGTVLMACGDSRYCNGSDCDVSEWTDIVDLAANQFGIFGLRTDGTIVHTSMNKYTAETFIGWTGIIDISASEHDLVGLTKDHTLLFSDERNLEEFHELKDVQTFQLYRKQVLAVTGDGRIYTTYRPEPTEDLGAVSYCVFPDTVFGVMEDGTIVADMWETGWTGVPAERNEVCTWTNVASLHRMEDAVVAICNDGTIRISGGQNKELQELWTGIRSPRR